MVKVFTVSLTLETMYLGPSLTTEPFLNHATVGEGLPLCELIKTASEPRVTTWLGVMTEVIVGIAVGKTTANDNSDISVHRHDHLIKRPPLIVQQSSPQNTVLVHSNIHTVHMPFVGGSITHFPCWLQALLHHWPCTSTLTLLGLLAFKASPLVPSPGRRTSTSYSPDMLTCTFGSFRLPNRSDVGYSTSVATTYKRVCYNMHTKHKLTWSQNNIIYSGTSL